MREGYGASQPKCGNGTANERESTPILRIYLARQGGENGAQGVETLDAGDHFPQRREGGRNMIEKIGSFLHQAEEAVGAQRLHEALHRAKIIYSREIGGHHFASRAPFREIVFEQFVAFRRCEVDIRIVQQRGQIVLHEAGAQSLEIDEAGAPIIDHDILRLKVTMHEDPGTAVEELGDLGKPVHVAAGLDIFALELKDAAEAILEEIILFPAVKFAVEFGLQLRRLDRRSGVRPRVQDQHLVERVLIEVAPHRPRLLAVAPKIAITQVFHPNQALGFVVKINLRHAHADFRQEPRDFHVVPVLLAEVAVLRKDERSAPCADAIELPIRAAFLERFDGNISRGETRKTAERLINEVGNHAWIAEQNWTGSGCPIWGRLSKDLAAAGRFFFAESKVCIHLPAAYRRSAGDDAAGEITF